MQTFRYLPPAVEEQKAFAVQFLGSLLGLTLIAVVWLRTGDAGIKGLLLGAAAGVLWMLARAAWSLEKKAQRSQHAGIGLDDDGLHITNDKGNTQIIPWTTITKVDVSGGRMIVSWPDGSFAVGARELENGMALVREVTKKRSHGNDSSSPLPPSNFIPLEPR
jgi:hypothetical protein